MQRAVLASAALPGIQYAYDANGNLTRDKEYCYEYNDANKVKEVRECTDNQLVAEYVYNAAGQRLLKTVYKEGVYDYTLISVNDIFDVKIYADGREETTTYYKANNELIAKKEVKNGIGTITYHHNDHLGSASMVTSTNGVKVEETKYLPYGEVRSGGSENLTGRYTYTGQESDGETGLMYYGARYYSAEIGRFVQPDSMLPDIYDPQQLNRYMYVRGNPLKYIDPSGHYAEIVVRDTLESGLFDFGHAMININGTYYGVTQNRAFTQNPNDIQTISESTFNNLYKDSEWTVYKLNLTKEQENQIVEYFESQKVQKISGGPYISYDLFSNNCVQNVLKALEAIGIDLIDDKEYEKTLKTGYLKKILNNYMDKQNNSNTKSLNITEKSRMIINKDDEGNYKQYKLKFEFLFWDKKEKEERKSQ
jgi:RHS repeat-associated protein